MLKRLIELEGVEPCFIDPLDVSYICRSTEKGYGAVVAFKNGHSISVKGDPKSVAEKVSAALREIWHDFEGEGK